MLTAEKFRTEWGPGLVCLPPDFTDDSGIASDVLEFLRVAGLPDEATPFLSFDQLARGPKRLYEIWGLPRDYSDDEKEILRPYWQFGSDGCGNPLVLDTANNCRVLWLDHEVRFRTQVFVNSSIFRFAEFLLETRNTLDQVGSEPSALGGYLRILFEKLALIDPHAMNDDAFWRPELLTLLV